MECGNAKISEGSLIVNCLPVVQLFNFVLDIVRESFEVHVFSEVFCSPFFPQQVCNTKTGGEGLKATWTIIIATIMSDCRMRLDDITVHGSVHSGKLTECG